MSKSTPIRVRHRRVGDFEIAPDDLIHVEGLPGFPDARRFALLGHDQPSPFSWLVCVDDAELAFIVTDPRAFVPDYAPPLAPRVLESVGAEKPGDVVLLAIANLSGKPPRLNLAAPLVLNLETRRAAQPILEDTRLSTAEPIASTSPVPEIAASPPQIESKPER